MRLTIAVCTWNRASLLSRALSSVCALEPVDCPVEVVVIDNNSADNTRAVVDGFRDRLAISYGFEARQGLSHARNAAAALASGDVVLWLDDDVLVEPGWLRAYARAFADRPQAAFFGGPIRPRFAATPPPWLVDALPRIAYAYALIDLGNEPFEFVPWDARAGTEGPQHARGLPFGANFAIRREWLKERRFSSRLGRVGDGGLLGEESEFLRRLLADGARGYWVPDACVDHWIPAARQTTGYLARYYAMSGATQARRTGPPGSQARLFGRSKSDLGAYLAASVRYLLRRARGDPRWVDSLVARSLARGRLRGNPGRPTDYEAH